MLRENLLLFMIFFCLKTIQNITFRCSINDRMIERTKYLRKTVELENKYKQMTNLRKLKDKEPYYILMKALQNRSGSRQSDFDSLRKRIRSFSMKRIGECAKPRPIETFPTNRRNRKHAKDKLISGQKNLQHKSPSLDNNPYHLPKPPKSKCKTPTNKKLSSVKSANILHGDKKQKKKKIKKRTSAQTKEVPHDRPKYDRNEDELVVIPEQFLGEAKKVSPRLKPKVKNPFERRMKLDKEFKNASIIPTAPSHELGTVDQAEFKQILQIVGTKT